MIDTSNAIKYHYGQFPPREVNYIMLVNFKTKINAASTFLFTYWNGH
jgi:hypothetical protein